MELTPTQLRVLKTIDALPPVAVDKRVTGKRPSPEVLAKKYERMEDISKKADGITEDEEKKVRCLEHPEWGFLSLSEAAAKIGRFAFELRRGVDAMQMVKSRIDKSKLRFVYQGTLWNDETYAAAHKEKYGHRKRKVRCIDTGVVYESLTDAAFKNGVVRNSISSAIAKGNSCLGSKWEFVETSDN